MKILSSALLSLFVFTAFSFPMVASAVKVDISGCYYEGSLCMCYKDGVLRISTDPLACSRIGGFFGAILNIINDILVPLIFALSFIVFLWGIFKAYIYGAGDDGERAKGHQLVLWGLIGFPIMISLWGLVNVVVDTFGLSGDSPRNLPTSF